MSLNDIELFDNSELIKFFKENNLIDWVPFLEETDMDGHTLMGASEYQIKIWSKVKSNDLWHILLKIKTNPESFNYPIKSKPKLIEKPNFSLKENCVKQNLYKTFNSNEDDDAYLKPISGTLKTEKNHKPQILCKPKHTILLESTYENDEDVKEATNIFGENKFNSFPRKKESNFVKKTTNTYDYIDETFQLPNNTKGRSLPPLLTENLNKMSTQNRNLPSTPDEILKSHMSPIPDESTVEIRHPKGKGRPPLPIPLDSNKVIGEYINTINNSKEASRRHTVILEDYSYAYGNQPVHLTMVTEDSSRRHSAPGEYVNQSVHLTMVTRGQEPTPLDSKGSIGEYINIINDTKKYVNQPVHLTMVTSAASVYVEMKSPQAFHTSKQKPNDHFPKNAPGPTFKSRPRTNLPCNNVDSLKINLKSEPFYRDTDRKGARLLLQGLEDGAFLFRRSENPNFFLTITILFKKNFFNVGIVKIGNKIRCDTLTKELTPEFSNLTDFVRYFQIEPITIRNDREYSIYLKPILPKSRY